MFALGAICSTLVFALGSLSGPVCFFWCSNRPAVLVSTSPAEDLVGFHPDTYRYHTIPTHTLPC